MKSSVLYSFVLCYSQATVEPRDYSLSVETTLVLFSQLHNITLCGHLPQFIQIIPHVWGLRSWAFQNLQLQMMMQWIALCIYSHIVGGKSPGWVLKNKTKSAGSKCKCTFRLFFWDIIKFSYRRVVLISCIWEYLFSPQPQQMFPILFNFASLIDEKGHLNVF